MLKHHLLVRRFHEAKCYANISFCSSLSLWGNAIRKHVLFQTSDIYNILWHISVVYHILVLHPPHATIFSIILPQIRFLLIFILTCKRRLLDYRILLFELAYCTYAKSLLQKKYMNKESEYNIMSKIIKL